MAGARYACVALVLAVAAALPDELKSASSTVYLVGSMPQGLRTDWLGAYDQLGKTKRWRSGLCDGRIIYAKQNDKSKMIWYHKKSAYWYVGRTRAAGKAAGVLSVKDHALMPEKISGHWKAWWGPKKSWIDAPELQCVGGNRGRKIFEAATLAVAGADKTVHLIGTTPLGQRHEWLGAYVQREGDLVGGRHAYTKVGSRPASLPSRPALAPLARFADAAHCTIAARGPCQDALVQCGGGHLVHGWQGRAGAAQRHPESPRFSRGARAHQARHVATRAG